MKSLDFSLLLIEGENVGTYLKSNITMTMMSGIFFFATGLSVRDAMHISETLAKSINGKSFIKAVLIENTIFIYWSLIHFKMSL